MNTKFVNVYNVQQQYGGCEEGGWYYDIGELITSIQVTTDHEAEQLQTELRNNKYSNEGRRPYYSVLSDGEYRVLIQDHPGKSFPERIPHYE